MPLTQEEKDLCRHAARTQPPRGNSWGSPALGLCPIGAVVTHRGGTLFLHNCDGRYHQLPEPAEGCPTPGTRSIVAFIREGDRAHLDALTPLVKQVTEDVWAWSGYTNWRHFTEALLTQGADALPPPEAECSIGWC